MRIVLQRVRYASVTVEGEEISRIGKGLLALVCVAAGDGEETIARAAQKIAGLRIFEDETGRMNLDLAGVSGSILVVSQFTLYGDATKGRRPSFVKAAPPQLAEPLYERVADLLGAQRGVFGAHMLVALENDGPVTLLLESEARP